MAHVLFVCLHNAGRSQMSQALFERAAGGRHDARLGRARRRASASTPRSSRSMRELGIDLADRVPQRLDRASSPSGPTSS